MSFPASSRRSPLHALAQHNPFYLLSAASMLLACLLLSNTTTWSPIPLRQLLSLIVTLSVYELLLVGLGVFLLRRRGTRRDGTMLLTLEAFFLVDIGFLNSEVAQIDLRAGVFVNAIVFALAAIKLWAIFRALHIGRSPALGLCMTMAAALLALPLVLKQASGPQSGDLPQRTLYAAWWVLGLLAAAYAALVRHERLLGQLDAGTRQLVHTLCVLPIISLAAHVGTSHWVYEAPFRAPDASPILLGLAVLLTAMTPGRSVTRSDIRVLCGLLPVAAVFTAMSSAPPLRVEWLGGQFTPLALTVAAAYCTVVYCLLLHRARSLMAVGGVAGAAYLLGPSPASIGDWIARGWRATIEAGRRLIPQTQTAWGVIALTLAFVLLALGAVVSLLRKPHSEGMTAA